MKVTLKLTLDGMKKALRLRAAQLADDAPRLAANGRRRKRKASKRREDGHDIGRA